MVTKYGDHRVAHDWAVGVLHLGSAALAAYAGWLAPTQTLAVRHTCAIAIGYGLPLDTMVAVAAFPVIGYRIVSDPSGTLTE